MKESLHKWDISTVKLRSWAVVPRGTPHLVHDERSMCCIWLHTICSRHLSIVGDSLWCSEVIVKHLGLCLSVSVVVVVVTLRLKGIPWHSQIVAVERTEGKKWLLPVVYLVIKLMALHVGPLSSCLDDWEFHSDLVRFNNPPDGSHYLTVSICGKSVSHRWVSLSHCFYL